MEQLNLNEMLVFVRVVQAGSFSAAGKLLGIPKSTVSRKVSELEQRLGVRLLQRTTRKLGLTDPGRTYFAHAARVVAGAQEAEQAVTSMQAAPRGLLRVTTPVSFGILGPLVSEYIRRNDEVHVEMLCTDRTVDIVEEGFDLAIRAGRLADSTLVARDLGTLKRVLVAEPGYCKKHGTPKTPAELKEHACIVFNAGPTPNLWSLESNGKSVEIRVTPRLAVNDIVIIRSAAIEGVGVAWLPAYMCAEDIRAKRLRHVLPDWCSAPTPVHAVYPTARHLSPKVGSFIELLRERLRLQL